jgi:hypothetical protein
MQRRILLFHVLLLLFFTQLTNLALTVSPNIYDLNGNSDDDSSIRQVKKSRPFYDDHNAHHGHHDENDYDEEEDDLTEVNDHETDLSRIENDDAGKPLDPLNQDHHFTDLTDGAAINHHHAGEAGSEKIMFVNNVTRCRMFFKKCLVKIVVKDLSVLNTLKITTQDRRIVDFKSFESCNITSDPQFQNFIQFSVNNNNYYYRNLSNSTKFSLNPIIQNSLQECLSIEKSLNNLLHNNHNNNNNKEIYTNQNFFLIRLKPKLVGVKYINISYNNLTNNQNRNTSASCSSSLVVLYHKVIISSPDRIIDKIQMIYVIFFSIVIAIIMGILIDLVTLFKIIKMPIAVLIGFIAQYLFMPLVSFLNLRFIFNP